MRIPAGVNDGSRVRVTGEGEHGAGGAAAGDLYLRVHLLPHPRFERRGRDLHVHVHVPVTTAVLGGEAEVPSIDGKHLRLKVPPTTQNGQVLRLKGHGMPAVGRQDDRGDLYATVDVRLPRSPDARADGTVRSAETTRGGLDPVEFVAHDTAQVHRKGPGGRARRATAFGGGQSPADRTGAPARRPARAGGGDRAGHRAQTRPRPARHRGGGGRGPRETAPGPRRRRSRPRRRGCGPCSARPRPRRRR